MTTNSPLNNALLRKLAEASGPCITVMVPRGTARDFDADVARRKNLLVRNLREQIKSYGVDAEGLTAPLLQAQPEVETGTYLAFRSPELFEEMVSPAEMAEVAVIEDTFDMRRLLAAREADIEFYLLALSMNRTRLLHCTAVSTKEVPLPAGTPQSLQDDAQTDQPDHVLDNRVVSGQSTAGKGVMFGTGTESEKSPERVTQFFTHLDKAVHSLLKNTGAPLIVAGVEYELAEYRRVNTYSHLFEFGVAGAPDGLKGGELHRRALELLQSRPPAEVEKLLNGFDKMVGTGHASVHARDIVKAAYEGRVSHLLLGPGASYMGAFDDVRLQVKRHTDELDKPRDLLNEAAIMTLRHGGSAYTLTGSQMPDGVPVAAVFRYPDPIYKL